MKYLQLELNNDYKLKFLDRQHKVLTTPFGPRYIYRVEHNGEETNLKATDKLRLQIEFYFKLHKQNDVILSVFNGGNSGVKYFNYLLISQ